MTESIHHAGRIAAYHASAARVGDLEAQLSRIERSREDPLVHTSA